MKSEDIVYVITEDCIVRPNGSCTDNEDCDEEPVVCAPLGYFRSRAGATRIANRLNDKACPFTFHGRFRVHELTPWKGHEKGQMIHAT